jgi:hypothetical protein
VILSHCPFCPCFSQCTAASIAARLFGQDVRCRGCASRESICGTHFSDHAKTTAFLASRLRPPSWGPPCEELERAIEQLGLLKNTAALMQLDIMTTTRPRSSCLPEAFGWVDIAPYVSFHHRSNFSFRYANRGRSVQNSRYP